MDIDDTKESTQQFDPHYAGHFEDTTPAPPDGYHMPREDTTGQCLNFPNPAVLVSFFDEEIASGKVTLHPWQNSFHEQLTAEKPTAKTPYKVCLRAANGSGKDKFIVAPFAIWFLLCKIRSRVIITSSSGVQLTSQTETYLKDLAEKVNQFFGRNVFKIRQRYIKCIDTGSECRMFATDEAGKAEGYHPIDATSEMAIIVNEGKTVTDDIHNALRRCTGFNYWLEVSTPGAPTGFFYQAATKWTNTLRVTSFDCPHLSADEIEVDRSELGEDSALFRSKHLAEFTTLELQSILPMELVLSLKESPPRFACPDLPERIGIDLAAGGDENTLCFTKGNRVRKEYWFKCVDTTVTADRIEQILIDEKIAKDYQYIYADDGGVGHSIIDMLMRKGWTVNRVMNQWTALGNKHQFSNRGAENWYRIKRMFEEKLIDISACSETTIEQLYKRQYKQSQSGKIQLQSKGEAKAHGYHSPDRADAFVLSLTGLTIESFQARVELSPAQQAVADFQRKHPAEKIGSASFADWYNDNVTFADFNHDKPAEKQRAFNSLRRILTAA